MLSLPQSQQMKKIVLFGAGKSAYTLVNYLAKEAKAQQWQLTIADINCKPWEGKFSNKIVDLVPFSLDNEALKHALIQESDLVISMLPARFHTSIAESCLHHSKNLITPSYVSSEMQAMDQEAKSKGLLFLNELGLDPGIDHMSAMKLIHHLKEQGAVIEI